MLTSITSFRPIRQLRSKRSTNGLTISSAVARERIMRLLLLGATGLVGSSALKLAIANPAISEVIGLREDRWCRRTNL
jgi:hypothetical protein